MMRVKPRIAITMGDPCGIGPEIVRKALRHPEVRACCRPIVVGTQKIITKAAEADPFPEDILRDWVEIPCPCPNQKQQGTVQAWAGQAAYDCIREASALALQGKADAIATAPINKEAWKAAGISAIGHTELLAELTRTKDPLTMFETAGLRIFFLTRHLSLRTACDAVRRERIRDYILRCAGALEQLGIRDGTLAIAALNPHGGEHGLFGDEENREITPAIQAARAEGCRVTGPVPADSVFHFAKQGKYAAVLSLYHDQGHIAAKTLDFERTISLTLGLPFLRTSVDHGTAFDIAGKDVASEVSMVEAILLAAKYAGQKAGGE